MPFIDQLFDSLYGIAYLVNREGRIADYTRRNWDQFATENGVPELTIESNIIGKSLLSFIAGEETRLSYKKIAEALFEKKVDAIGFAYRCDSPAIRRDMLMAITPIKIATRIEYLLYHSLPLTHHQRVPVGLLNRITTDADCGHRFVTLGICSYCNAVRFPAGTNKGEWIEAEEYYRRGGSEKVMLSHAICPHCYDAIVATI